MNCARDLFQDADELWELFNGAKEELIESAMGDADDAEIGEEDDDLIEEEDEEEEDEDEEDDDEEAAGGNAAAVAASTSAAAATGGENRNLFEELFAAVMLAKDPNDS